MMKAMAAGAVLVAVGCLTTGAAILVRGGDEPSKTPEPTKAIVTAREPARPASLEEQFRRIVAEFDEARERAGQAASDGKTEFERWKILVKESPEEADYARRMIDLAAAHPRERASRDALIWVLDKPYRADANAYGDEFSRAVNLLVKYHADDPEVARVGLDLDNVLSRRRDAFLEGIYASANCREARGLAAWRSPSISRRRPNSSACTAQDGPLAQPFLDLRRPGQTGRADDPSRQ